VHALVEVETAMSPQSLPTEFVAALSDPQIAALTLWGEARGEPIEGKVAVGCVLRNRVDDGRWGRSYAKVCLAPWQFSCWRPEGGRENYEALMRLAQRLTVQGPLPDDVVFRECIWVATGIVGGWLRDSVRDATHYVTTELFERRPPKWAVNQVPCARVAQHVFFRGIR
jgi:N-acetylmuramoyl-L-alanine amidase